MKKIRDLYNDSISEDLQAEDIVNERLKLYSEYKKDYIRRCKEERRLRYSFFQRNKFFLIAVLPVVGLIIVLTIAFSMKESEHTSSASIVNEDDYFVENTEVVENSLQDIDNNETDDNSILNDDQVESEVDELAEVTENQLDDENTSYDELENDSSQIGDLDTTVEEIVVGSRVKFIGDTHYTSSSANAEGTVCASGDAIVTKISEGSAHPYHILSIDNGTSVYGWVNSEDVIIE